MNRDEELRRHVQLWLRIWWRCAAVVNEELIKEAFDRVFSNQPFEPMTTFNTVVARKNSSRSQ